MQNHPNSPRRPDCLQGLILVPAPETRTGWGHLGHLGEEKSWNIFAHCDQYSSLLKLFSHVIFICHYNGNMLVPGKSWDDDKRSEFLQCIPQQSKVKKLKFFLEETEETYPTFQKRHVLAFFRLTPTKARGVPISWATVLLLAAVAFQEFKGFLLISHLCLMRAITTSLVNVGYDGRFLPKTSPPFVGNIHSSLLWQGQLWPQNELPLKWDAFVPTTC